MTSTITSYQSPIAVQVWAEVSARLGVKRYIDLSPRQRNAYWREVRRRKESQSTDFTDYTDEIQG